MSQSMYDEPRSLMSRPQRLGILPTLWFWREVGAERPMLGILIGVPLGVFTAVVGALLLELAGPIAFIAAPLVPLLGFGIIERGLRRLVLRRRHALACGEPQEALPSPEVQAHHHHVPRCLDGEAEPRGNGPGAPRTARPS